MNLCSGRSQPTPEEIISSQPPKISEPSALPLSETSKKSVTEEMNGSESLLKTWNSFPEQLNDVNLADSTVMMARNSVAMDKEEKKDMKEKVAQSIELSDVIKVDYSDTKEIEGSTFTEKMSPGEFKTFVKINEIIHKIINNLSFFKFHKNQNIYFGSQGNLGQ